MSTTTTHPESHWQTALFAGGATRPNDSGRLSPRAAYQQLLHRRAVLLDIRTPQQRDRHGRIHPDLHPVVAEHGPPTPQALPTIVLCQEGHASLVTVETLRAAGHEATDVDGGYAAWSALGLPTV